MIGLNIILIRVVARKCSLLNDSSISERDDSQRATMIMQNWHYLKTVIVALLYCAQQEVALRGHREGIDSKNRGNNGPKNAKYTSPGIQTQCFVLWQVMLQQQYVEVLKKVVCIQFLQMRPRTTLKQNRCPL